MDELTEYQQRRLDLADMLRAVMHVARHHNDAEREREARELLTRLAAGRFQLAVLGQFSRGKTTLMNALLGGAYLPMGRAAHDLVPLRKQAARAWPTWARLVRVRCRGRRAGGRPAGAAKAGTPTARKAASRGATRAALTSAIGTHAPSSSPLPSPLAGSHHSRPRPCGRASGLDTGADTVLSSLTQAPTGTGTISRTALGH